MSASDWYGAGGRFRNKIYVGNLSSKTSERDIREKFERYGRVVDVILKYDFAFVEMENDKDMEVAMDALDGMDVHGKEWVVEPAKRGPRKAVMGRGREGGVGSQFRRPAGMRPVRGNYRIQILGLSSATSWQDLKDWARQAGDSVVYGDVFVENGRRMGVIEYDRREHYEDSMKILDNKRLHGKYLRVYGEGDAPMEGHDGSGSDESASGDDRARSGMGYHGAGHAGGHAHPSSSHMVGYRSSNRRDRVRDRRHHVSHHRRRNPRDRGITRHGVSSHHRSSRRSRHSRSERDTDRRREKKRRRHSSYSDSRSDSRSRSRDSRRRRKGSSRRRHRSRSYSSSSSRSVSSRSSQHSNASNHSRGTRDRESERRKDMASEHETSKNATSGSADENGNVNEKVTKSRSRSRSVRSGRSERSKSVSSNKSDRSQSRSKSNSKSMERNNNEIILPSDSVAMQETRDASAMKGDVPTTTTTTTLST